MNLFGAFCILHFIDRRPPPRPLPPDPASFFLSLDANPPHFHSFIHSRASFLLFHARFALSFIHHFPFHHFCHLSIDPGIDYPGSMDPFMAHLRGDLSFLLNHETIPQSINHHQSINQSSTCFAHSFLPPSLPPFLPSCIPRHRRSPLACPHERTNERTNERTEAFIRYSILRRCVAAGRACQCHANAMPMPCAPHCQPAHSQASSQLAQQAVW